jgi:dolichyl-diphosphooligosaccharide--protein glycosyltransferase
MPMKERAQSRERLIGLAAFAAALLGVAVRSMSWRDCFRQGGAVPYGVDGSYHLWRAEGLAASFPSIPLHDPYVSFPQGAVIPWPPGLDLVIAIPGFLGLGGGAMAAMAALLMPLLGGLAVYLLFRLGRAVFDPVTGLAAALILAFMPGAVADTFLGRIDHHALVAPVTLGIFLSFLACVRSESVDRRLGWGSLCGLLAAAAVLSWPVSPPLFFLPVPLTLVLLSWTRERGRARVAAAPCLVSAFLFVLLVIVPVADLENRPFDLYQPSLFITVPYLLAALLVPAFLAGWRYFFAASGALLALVAAAGFFGGGWFGVAREAFSVVGGENLSYMMAIEALPLFSGHQAFNLNYAVHYFTYFVLLAPFFFLAFAWDTVRKGEAGPPRILFGAVFLIGFGLMVFQSRFREFAAPPFALLTAWALVGLGRSLLGLRRESERSRVVALSAAGTAAAAFALAPLVTNLYERGEVDKFSYPAKVYAFARDFASDVARMGPGEGAARGILSSWSDSHRLLHATGLPVMASSFGTASAQRMNAKAFRILLGQDEEDAAAMMKENRIRFIVVSSIFSEVESMARMAGLDEEFLLIRRDAYGAGRYKPLRPFFDTLHSRLYLGYGSTTEITGYRLKPLSRFRLVTESEWGETVLEVPKTMMAAFEVVEGVTIRGRTDPGRPVILSLDLRTNLDRTFRYIRRTLSDGEGRYEFTVPYWTDGGTERTRALGPYRLQTAKGVSFVDVSERDVRQGAAVPVDGGPE